MKILVVEDDRIVADALKTTLSNHNYAVEVAHDGQAGLECLKAFDYDLLILDSILPDLDGIDLCRSARSHGYMMPILLLTSKDGKHDQAIGLDAGADDYVVKPFDPIELAARIRALLRRANDRVKPILTWYDLTLDPHNYEVTYKERLLALTPKEYALLELFLRHNQRLFSCNAILEHLWAYEDAPSEEAVRTHIKGLRHKLKAVGAPHNLVETVYGIGYRLKPCDPLTQGLNLTSTPAPNTRIDTSPMLAAIWNRYYDQMSDRVETIKLAIESLASGELSDTVRRQAWQSAHTLAGSLGTFGLPIGSQLAKQIESILEAKVELTPDRIPQLQQRAAELRETIKSKMAPQQAQNLAPEVAARSIVITQDPDLERSLQAASVERFEIVNTTNFSERWHPAPPAIVFDLEYFTHSSQSWQALSALETNHPGVPILVLSPPTRSTVTANNSPDNLASQLDRRIEVARRGGRMYLAKPILANEIVQAIDRVVARVNTRKASITIVDDDRALLAALSVQLAQANLRVTALSEPSQFWETLEASQPDLLILDLEMPMYDGIELCRAVRTDPKWATLPIVFLTAHGTTVTIDRVFAAGADDFIHKPTTTAELVNRIVNRLDRIEQQRRSLSK